MTTFALSALAAALDLLAPVVRRSLQARVRRGKEDPSRLAERFGIASARRGKGPVLWVHGASLGETASLMPIVQWYLGLGADHQVVFTSITKSSGDRLSRQLPDGAVHQYLPAENGRWISAFLAHWRPFSLVLAEQEMWPRLLIEVSRQDLPVLCVNARLSAKSARVWRWAARFGLGVPLLLDQVHCQNQAEAKRFSDLGHREVAVTGNLKFAGAGSPPVRMPNHVRRLCFAMTHGDEEPALLTLASVLCRRDPELEILFGPRHVERADQVEGAAAEMGFSVVRWSQDGSGGARGRFTLVDQYGVMDQVYAHADLCVLGGSFSDTVGGHSPLEALKAGVGVIVGPHMSSQQSIMDILVPAGAIVCVKKASALQSQIEALIRNPAPLADNLKAFAQVSRAGDGALAAAQGWIEDQLSPTEPEA